MNTATAEAGGGDAPLLECRNITVRFGGVIAVNDVSLELHRGEVLGLIGPNGSGKSTLLNAVSGLVHADGQVFVSGQPISMTKPGAIVKHNVFRTYQTPQVDKALTCIENVLVASTDTKMRGPIGSWVMRPSMWRHERGRWAEAMTALERVGLARKARDTALGLSYGEQRHLEIARALIAHPTLLLMDEPAAGLNSAETTRLSELLKGVSEGGISLLIIDHKISFLESLCQRMVVLELGRQIAGGTPAEVWADPAVAAAYLGVAS